LFPFSDQGIGYCNNAILRGDLTRRDLAATYSNRGIIHSKSGKFEKALADHDQAVRLKPDMPQVHINRGNALYYVHEYKQALTEFDKAIAAQTGPISTALFNKALTLIKLHRVGEAKAILDSALETDPDSNRIKKILDDIASLDETS
jgi:tetratricopeptide (TPR) repeat protein